MKTEEIIELLQFRCADGGFNDYLLVNALSRLRTLQSIGKQRDELLEALEQIFARKDDLLNEYLCEFEILDARKAIAKAKGKK